MRRTSNRMRLGLCVALLTVLTLVGAFAQSNSELYRSGQIGYASGNCVKAARFWFAYLIREPPELNADPNRRAKIERVIRDCDEEPMRFAYTTIQYSKKLPGKEGRCQIYAELAVAQFEANELSGCNQADSRWNADYTGHFNWCMTARDLDADAERRARDQVLRACAK
jgi:hypothetical protein